MSRTTGHTSDLEFFAAGDSFVHRRDPRAAVVVTAAYVLAVVSNGKFDLVPLLPLAAYPVFLALVAGIPLRTLSRRLLWALPFVMFIAVLNPFLDTRPALRLGGWTVNAGLVSSLSIIARFVLTVSASVLLVATVGFNDVCAALENLGLPRVFAVQLMMLYRYIHVLGDEAGRMHTAYRLRACGDNSPGMSVYISMVGRLLVRAVARAERVYTSMRCRGFYGRFYPERPARLSAADIVYSLGWILFFAVARFSGAFSAAGDKVLELFG